MINTTFFKFSQKIYPSINASENKGRNKQKKRVTWIEEPKIILINDNRPASAKEHSIRDNHTNLSTTPDPNFNRILSRIYAENDCNALVADEHKRISEGNAILQSPNIPRNIVVAGMREISPSLNSKPLPLSTEMKETVSLPHQKTVIYWEGMRNEEMQWGDFENGLLNGEGRITWPNRKQMHEGIFKEGKLIKGVIHHPDGSMEQGSFNDAGKLHGDNGSIKYPNGESLIGEFDNGSLINGEKELPRGRGIEKGVFDQQGKLVEGTIISCHGLVLYFVKEGIHYIPQLPDRLTCKNKNLKQQACTVS